MVGRVRGILLLIRRVSYYIALGLMPPYNKINLTIKVNG